MNKHEDRRGFFQELLRASYGDFGHFDIKQINWFSINPGETRGAHFHKIQKEMFVILEGAADITMQRPTGLPNTSHNFGSGNVMLVLPFEKHTFFSKNGCKILTLSDREFDANDPDTYVDFKTGD